MGCSSSIGLSVTPEQGEGILISNSQPVILKSNRATLKPGSETLIGTPAIEEVRDTIGAPINGGKSWRVVPESVRTDSEIDGRTCNQGNDVVKKKQLMDQDINALTHEVHESGLLHRELKDIVNPMNMIAAIKRGDIETVKRITAVENGMECHVINAVGEYHLYLSDSQYIYLYPPPIFHQQILNTVTCGY